MDLVPEAKDALTSNTLNYLATPFGESFSQNALGMYASQWPDIVNNPANGIAPDTPSNWRWLVLNLVWWLRRTWLEAVGYVVAVGDTQQINDSRTFFSPDVRFARLSIGGK